MLSAFFDVLLILFFMYIVGKIGSKWLMSDGKKKTAKEESYRPRHSAANVQPKKETPVPTAPTKEKVFPSEWMGRKRNYAYTGVRLYIVPGQEPDFKALDPGDDLWLVQEKDNSYDNTAVYLETFAKSRAGRVKVGYLKKNKLKDMANDFLDKGLPILAHIETIEDDEGWVEVAMAFYRDSVVYEDIEGNDDD